MDEKTTVPGIYRSQESKALINKDNESLAAYKKRRNAARLVTNMYKEIQEMKSVIEQLIKRIEFLENNK